MGQGGVGKTAMVLRFTTGDFNEQVRGRARARGARARCPVAATSPPAARARVTSPAALAPAAAALLRSLVRGRPSPPSLSLARAG